MEYELYRLDCYSYSPRPKDPGADLRVEMRVVYQSVPGRDLQSSELPEEVYYLFPLPEGGKEEEFKQQVMTNFSEAVREATGMDILPDKKSNTPATGFRIRGGGKRVVVYKPIFDDWIEGRKGLVVRAERY